MKAIVYAEYGPPDVLQLKETEKPVPKENEVLVKILATSVNYSDWGFVRGKPFMVRMWSGFLKPKQTLLGADIAGRIEAIGSNAKQFKPGDEVFAEISGVGWGGFAEYVAVPGNALVLKPANLTFEEAAAVPQAACVALQGLRDKGHIQKGQKVLVFGASGGIGTFAVQIARSFGAEVTGVCSTSNLDLVRSIGADHVIDYTQEDFTRNGLHYDLILATAGFRSLFDYRRALSPTGIHVATGGSLAQVFQPMLLGPWLTMFGKKKLCTLSAKADRNDLEFIKGLIEAGKVKPVIDRRFTLKETAEALRYYGKGHSRGKVVITM
ncbi:MAG: NAD(P)-dependent alcohol dehydrogenase [bacterium]|nr:NAD(P)-dependent alcohol dehydrogenase [bacterium]